MKDFQQLVNKNIITNLVFNVDKVPGTKEEGILYLINKKLITQPGMAEYVKTWWDTEESNLPEPDPSKNTVHTTLDDGKKVQVLSDDVNTSEKEQDPVITTTSTKEPMDKKTTPEVKETKLSVAPQQAAQPYSSKSKK